MEKEQRIIVAVVLSLIAAVIAYSVISPALEKRRIAREVREKLRREQTVNAGQLRQEAERNSRLGITPAQKTTPRSIYAKCAENPMFANPTTAEQRQMNELRRRTCLERHGIDTGPADPLDTP